MRRKLAGLLVFAGLLPGTQAERREERTKFTADELSAIAKANPQAFVRRFRGKTLDVRGTVVSRDMTSGTATLRMEGITCRSTENASLQALAVLPVGHEVRVQGVLSAGGLLSPCTILTNNIRISPTSELTAPYVREETKKGPPQGRYRCADQSQNLLTGWVTVLSKDAYSLATGNPGRYHYDDEEAKVFFDSGPLGGGQAEFKVSEEGRVLTLFTAEGAKRTCRWEGR